MGNRCEAEAVMARSQDLSERVSEPDDDEAFRFSERRHLLYLSGTLTSLGMRFVPTGFRSGRWRCTAMSLG